MSPLRVDRSQPVIVMRTAGIGATLPLEVASAKDRSLHPEQPVIRERRRLRGGALGGELHTGMPSCLALSARLQDYRAMMDWIAAPNFLAAYR